MKFSKWKLISLIAILMLSFGVGNPEVFAKSLKDMKDERKTLDEKKKNLNSNIQMKDEKISENTSKVEKIQAEIDQLNREVQQTNENIMALENEIEETVNEIDALQESIADLEQKIQDRDEVLRERIRAMHSNGGTISYLDVLLGANSFADFIDRITAVNTLIDADRQIMKDQADDQKQLEEEKKLVEQKLQSLEADKVELEGLKKSLEGQRAKQDKLVQSLKVELANLSTEKEELETELHEVYNLSEEITKEIEAEEKRLAELARQAEIERKKREEQERQRRQQQAGANKGSSSVAPAVSSGTWTRPSRGRVSSEFGPRNLGYGSTNHRGIDIAAPIGTPVVAAGNGVVARAGALSTLGNIVMITHSVDGKIYTTLYAHLSSIHVSAGQTVSKGQTVGNIGMTGLTSGPHLHFEFHIGGWTGYGPTAVNPRNYVPF